MRKVLVGLIVAAAGVNAVPMVEAQNNFRDGESPVRFPKTTGPHQVATDSFHVIDESRDELHTLGNRSDKRELMVQVWYPAEASRNAEPVLWLDDSDVFIPAAKKAFPKIPDAFWSGCAKILANSVPGADFVRSAAKVPVVIYAHGWNQSRTENTYLMEELASHGYIAFAIDFPYNARSVRFPDGRVIFYDPETGGVPEADIHVKDVQFLLSHLEKMNSSSNDTKFGRHMDLKRVAIIGFSHGGVTTIKTLKLDLRFKAGIIMDGYHDLTGIQQPFMILGRSQTPVPFNKDEPGFVAGGYVCKIRATRHFNYCDLALAWALLELPGGFPQPSPENDPRRIHRIIADFCLSFLNNHLNSKGGSLLRVPSSKYPEVEFTVMQGSRSTPLVIESTK